MGWVSLLEDVEEARTQAQSPGERLKITGRASRGDNDLAHGLLKWCKHIEQTMGHAKALIASDPDAMSSLDLLRKENHQALEKIGRLERALEGQRNEFAAKLNRVQREFAAYKSRARSMRDADAKLIARLKTQVRREKPTKTTDRQTAEGSLFRLSKREVRVPNAKAAKRAARRAGEAAARAAKAAKKAGKADGAGASSLGK